MTTPTSEAYAAARRARAAWRERLVAAQAALAAEPDPDAYSALVAAKAVAGARMALAEAGAEVERLRPMVEAERAAAGAAAVRKHAPRWRKSLAAVLVSARAYEAACAELRKVHAEAVADGAAGALPVPLLLSLAATIEAAEAAADVARGIAA